MEGSLGAERLVLREFLKGDQEFNQYFLGKGFFKVDIPNSNEVALKWNDFDEFLKDLPRVQRKNVKREALRYEGCFDVEVKNQLSKEEAVEYYGLFINVKRRNLGLNFFDYPPTILETMSQYPSWEFIILKLKPEYDDKAERKAAAVLWCFKGALQSFDYRYGLCVQFRIQGLQTSTLPHRTKGQRAG